MTAAAAPSGRDGSRGAAGPVPVVVAASGAPWEPALLEVLAAARRRVALVRRCLDLTDLLATAGTGSARVAVVSDQLPGLDADSVGRLETAGVRLIGVLDAPATAAGGHPVPPRTRLERLGVARVVAVDALATVPEAVEDLRVPDGGGVAESSRSEPGPDGWPGVAPLLEGTSPGRPGRLVAVWGPGGAPGRTTLTLCLAARAAGGGRRALALDADPYGGALGQHLAVVDGASGLLAATRMANSGQLDPLRLAGVAREVAPRLRVLTGLPRPDRWSEVRPQAFARLLQVARELDEVVVVDTGSVLPGSPADPFTSTAQRDEMTATALREADAVLVVGAPDPVGLTRLARALQELREVRPAGSSAVVVNRMRSGPGWSEHEVRMLLRRVDEHVPVGFVPDDRAAADRALLSGAPLLDTADAGLRRALVAVADPVLGAHRGSATRRRRKGLLLRR